MRYILFLHRFDEAGVTSQAAAESTGVDAEQAAAAGNETKVSFDELINGEYREDYEKAVTKVVRQRLSGARANEAKLAKMEPIMQALASKYGTEADDIDTIAKYVGEDESLYEDAAMRAGLTVDQYKRMAQIEAENRRLVAERELNEQRRAADAQVEKWREEAEQIKAEFPDFDLATMIQDERYRALVTNAECPLSLKEAYVAMKMDDILPQVMGYTAQEVAKKTAATIAQKGSRPTEGGISNRAAARVNTDVSKLSNAEIAEMARLIKAGKLTHL